MEEEICLFWEEEFGWHVLPEGVWRNYEEVDEDHPGLCLPLNENYTEVFHMLISVKNRYNKNGVVPVGLNPVQSFFR